MFSPDVALVSVLSVLLIVNLIVPYFYQRNQIAVKARSSKR